MVMLNQLDKNFPAMLFEMVYYNQACDAYIYLGFHSNLKCGIFFLSTRYKQTRDDESKNKISFAIHFIQSNLLN